MKTKIVVAGCALALAAMTGGCAEETGGVAPLGAQPVASVASAGIFVNECDARGTGSAPGDKAADFTLENCYGEPVALHDYCGRRKAVWLIGSAGWCGACSAYVPGAFREFLERRHEGVELFVVLSEDPSYAPPTQEYCLQYAEEKGLDPSRVLIDNGFETLWRELDPGASSIGLPWEAVLDPFSMEFVWANSYDATPVDAALGELLGE